MIMYLNDERADDSLVRAFVVEDWIPFFVNNQSVSDDIYRLINERDVITIDAYVSEPRVGLMRSVQKTVLITMYFKRYGVYGSKNIDDYTIRCYCTLPKNTFAGTHYRCTADEFLNLRALVNL